VKKALVVAGVAAVALAGAIVAVVVASGSGDTSARPGSSGDSTSVSESVSGSDSEQRSTQSTTTPSAATSTATTPLVPVTTVELPPPPPPGSPRERTFIVGTVDDSLAQKRRAAARSQIDISHRAGFDAVAISAKWRRGRTKPPGAALRAIRNVAAATRRDHMRLFLVIWHGFARGTPRGSAERAAFASFAATVVRSLPHLDGVIVGNEPNLSTFWKPQFGPGGSDAAAFAYEDLLARTYDALKRARPGIRVIGAALAPRGADRPRGIRPTHSPTAFIRDLGRAYRLRGRHRPLMDAFAMHPYMIAPWTPPTIGHPQTTQITLADYPKLVTLLDEAFRGTAQRGRTLPILYTEFGVQTVIPPVKRRLYEAGAAYDAEYGVPAARQGEYYRRALALAYCQPTVQGLFIFHTFDESALNGWQSGLYYDDRTPKPSLPVFRKAVADLRAGKLTACRG
jgi:hypothetical protein